MKKRVPKTLRKVVISILVMLFMFVAIGVGYVYFSGANSPEPVTSISIPKESSPLPKPVAPSPNAPVGVAVSSLTTPAKIGENSSLSVQTNAGSKCTVTVTYGGVASKDSGLGPVTANPYGTATWTWTVTGNTPLGIAPVKVTCVYNGRSAVVQDNQVITK